MHTTLRPRPHRLTALSRGLRAAPVALVLALPLTGCGTAEPASPSSAATSTAVSTAAVSTAAADQASAAGLTLIDGWAKAVPALDDRPMTGVFGTLSNPTDRDIHLTAGSSPVAGTVELHETTMDGAAMVMREAADGFVIPARGALVLEPGGLHIMLMALVEAIPAGTDVDVTLSTEDGSDVTVTVSARTFAGAEETYAPGQQSPTSEESSATHTP